MRFTGGSRNAEVDYTHDAHEGYGFPRELTDPQGFADT
jgi:hypothetical protein